MKSFLSRVAGVIILFGLVLGYMGVSDCYHNSKTPMDYATIKESDIKKGMIIEGDLQANMGAFQESYTTTNGVKSGNSKYSYMIPIGDKQYMGLENNTNAMNTSLEQQAKMTYSYLLGESTTEPTVVHFKGRVKKMDNETKGYLRSYMIDFGFEQSEVDNYLLDYYIQCENYDGWLTELAIALILLVIGGTMLILPILAIRRKNAAVNHNFSGAGTVVSDSSDNNMGVSQTDSNVTTSAFQTPSDYRSDELHTEGFENQTFEYNDIDSLHETKSSSFGSGLGEGMLDDYQSFDEK